LALAARQPTQDEVRTSWIRLLSLPRQGNPAVDMTGANCAAAQPATGVWFLQSTIGGHANRTCTIPANTDIICNVISCELSDPELPGRYPTDRELENEVQNSINHVELNSLRFLVDNRSLINRWQNFRVLTPASSVFIPDSNYENLFRVQGGYSTRFAADGYYVKLTHLSAGPHTLSFGGAVQDPGGRRRTFETSVDYNLTIL
jgi:hypothetical protein